MTQRSMLTMKSFYAALLLLLLTSNAPCAEGFAQIQPSLASPASTLGMLPSSDILNSAISFVSLLESPSLYPSIVDRALQLPNQVSTGILAPVKSIALGGVGIVAILVAIPILFLLGLTLRLTLSLYEIGPERVVEFAEQMQATNGQEEKDKLFEELLKNKELQWTNDFVESVVSMLVSIEEEILDDELTALQNELQIETEFKEDKK